MNIESIQSFIKTKVKDYEWQWHFTYGSVCLWVKNSPRENMVIGLPEILIPSRDCEERVVGKQHHSQFPNGKSWWAKDDWRWCIVI